MQIIYAQNESHILIRKYRSDRNKIASQGQMTLVAIAQILMWPN